MTTTPNMDTVRLLTDLQIHLDGSPLTPDEIDVVMAATAADFQAAAVIWELRALEMEGIAALYVELQQIIATVAEPGSQIPLGELLPALPSAQQIRARELIRLIESAEEPS